MPRPDETGPALSAAGPTVASPASAATARPGPSARAAGRAPVAVDVPATPARPTLLATLVYAAATLMLGWPALLGRFLVNEHSDQYIAGYAFREFATESLRAGQGFPLWNPFLFGGMPYVAAMHGDIFYPTFLLRLALGTDAGMTWGMILHVFLAGLFTYLFLRAAGIGFYGALVGGLAYLMGGNVAGLVSPGHDGKIFVSAMLPLALLFVHHGVRGGRLWAWGGLALAVMGGVLSPHPQLLQYMLLLTGCYALFCAFSRDEAGEGLARGSALGRLGAAAGAVAIGMLGGAIQFWPLFEYTPWSPRAGGKGWDHAISFSMPLEELINVYLPQFSGILDAYTGRNGIHFHSEYIGAAVLVLAGLAFGIAAAKRRFLWFWTGALVVSTLWALGGSTPFFNLVYYLVPGTKYFRAPSTMLYIVQLCVAVLAAIGVERVMTQRLRPRYAFAWIAAAAAIALMATSGMLTNLAAAVAHPALATQAQANGPALTLGGWRSFLAVAATCGVLLGLLRGALRPAAAGWGLVGIIALDLWSIERLYWRFSPPADQLYAGDAVIDYLKTHSDSGRVVPIATEALTGTMRDPYFGSGDGRAAGLMAHGIRSVVGYHGNQLGRFLTLSGWSDGQEGADWPRQLGNPNFWRLLNIRYLYTNAAQPPIEGAQRVAGPVRNAAGNMAYLYRLPGDNPPAWVAPLAVKAGDENVLATVLDPRFDVGRAALFDSAATVTAQPVPPQLPAPLDLTARITARSAERIEIALDRPAPAGSALVVSENYYPGWTATVDGRPATVARADYLLMGVPLPAGARQVALTFTSPRYETGKLITLAMLALSGVAVVAGVALERRRRA